MPETILLYAGVRYLRHFLYRNRLWQAPARVPLHLGRQGYRDVTLRRRGAATWSIGTTVPDGQQVWLLREDLARGSVYIAEDHAWHEEMTVRLIHGAYLHQTGAIIVQAHDAPGLCPRFVEVARPFGRDAEIAAVNFHDARTAPLHVTESAIMAALADRGLTPSAYALARLLLPILSWLGPRLSSEPLTLFPTLLDSALLEDLASGSLRLRGIDLRSADAQSALASLLRPLDEIAEDHRAQACSELRPYARELAAASGLSISRGVDLSAAMASRRITCIRPSSSWTTRLVTAACIEALATFDPKSLSDVILHIAGPVLSASLSDSVLADAAKRAGAVISFGAYGNDNMSDFIKACDIKIIVNCLTKSDSSNLNAVHIDFKDRYVELISHIYKFDGS
ncbi:hypothetical protein [Methylobacterium sp. SI9]|uniref:hypothetical protein n=1 Tax=Methylobacterium guangdongense TaxID=3138811 RepID=UPI00313C3726